MSAATRAKLAAAAKARWARQSGRGPDTVSAASGGASQPKKRAGGLTAAGRKRLSESMKARWATRRRAAA